MKPVALLATTVIAVALSACSGGNEAPDAVPDGEASAVASDAAVASVAADDTIPEGLRGRWGLTQADCTDTQGVATGLLSVGARKLSFYESVADLGMIKRRDADRITAAFEFSGEGQTWVLDVTLYSPDGGKTLVRNDTGPDAAPEPITYIKCP